MLSKSLLRGIAVKTLKSKLMLIFTLVILIPAAYFIISSIYTGLDTTSKTVETMYPDLVENVSARTSANINVFRAKLEIIAKSKTISDNLVSTGARVAELVLQASNAELDTLGLCDKNNKGLTSNGDEVSFADCDILERVMTEGKGVLSEPIKSRTSDEWVYILAEPFYYESQSVRNAKIVTTSELAGFVYVELSLDFVRNELTSTNLGQDTQVFMVGRNDIITAGIDNQSLAQGVTYYDYINDDSGIVREKISGSDGITRVDINSENCFFYSTPIEGTDWSLFVQTPSKHYFSDFYSDALVSLIVAFIIIAIGIIASLIISKSIALPIKQTAMRLKQMAEGDFSSPVPKAVTKDETAELLNALEKSIEQIRLAVSGVSYHIGLIANGDLTADDVEDYMGDLLPLSEAVHQIKNELFKTMTEINVAADRVTDSSEQVSAGAHSLSAGSSHQAEVVGELVSTISEVSEKVRKNADSSNGARSMALDTGNELSQCNGQMQGLISAMEEIRQSSNEISKIIKIISDIAFQTNMLSLNASIEAARAGNAGKGFAVVAGEVGALAKRSADASESTAVLIEAAIAAVDKGTRLVGKTADMLMQSVANSETLGNTISAISDESEAQADSILLITNQLDEIASVVRSNSATAEESAAASQELFAQAHSLKDLSMKFKLTNETEVEDLA